MPNPTVNQNSTFDYAEIQLPEDCIFKISPSAISKFFEMPVIWYKEQVLKETQFEGNTASVLGSIIHGLAEQYVKGEKSSRENVEEYLAKYQFNTNVDLEEIRTHYPNMASILINEYVRRNKPTEVERSLCKEIKDGVYLAGTFDNRTGSTLIDYKSTSTKPKTDKIPWNYYIQLMAYAWLLKQEGTTIDRIRIVWIVKPTKTLPVRIFVVNQTIEEKDYQAIEDVLQIISDTILLVKEQPELTYLLFKSMQLKES